MSSAEKGTLTFFAGLIVVYHLVRWPAPGVLIGIGLIVYALIRAARRFDYTLSSKIKVCTRSAPDKRVEMRRSL
ncbi:MAG: hypothetical protein ACXW6V_22195 [Candidatus Binatia bacterium]